MRSARTPAAERRSCVEYEVNRSPKAKWVMQRPLLRDQIAHKLLIVAAFSRTGVGLV